MRAETGTLPRASTAAAPPASLMPGVISRRAKTAPPLMSMNGPVELLVQADTGGVTRAGGSREPIFVAHGVDDPLVPVEWGRQVAEFLKEERYSPAFHEYPMGHEISPALVKDHISKEDQFRD